MRIACDQTKTTPRFVEGEMPRYAHYPSSGGEKQPGISAIVTPSKFNPVPKMASLAERLSTNVAGRFYVDSTCIDCDQCRTLAPDFFGRDEESGTSFVRRQPESPEDIATVQDAATNCATASIGDDGAE